MKKPISAADLMAKLDPSPEFVRRRERRERELGSQKVLLDEAEEPLLADLKTEAELDLSSVWDLVSSDVSHPSAFPVLAKHLTREYPAPVLAGIARALADPQARAAWPTLRAEYKKSSSPQVREGLAVAIAAMSTKEDLPELLKLLRARRLGPSRSILLTALERLDMPSDDQAYIDLAEDPDLRQEIKRIVERGSGAIEAHPEGSILSTKPGLEEVSAGVSVDQFRAATQMLTGLGCDLRGVHENLQKLGAKQTSTFQFDVQGKPLFLRIRKSDADSVEFWLFANHAITAEVRRVVEHLIAGEQ